MKGKFKMAVKHWSVEPAKNKDELMDVLYIASSGLKTQVIASEFLADPDYADIKQQISDLADKINGFQLDISIL